MKTKFLRYATLWCLAPFLIAPNARAQDAEDAELKKALAAVIAEGGYPSSDEMRLAPDDESVFDGSDSEEGDDLRARGEVIFSDYFRSRPRRKDAAFILPNLPPIGDQGARNTGAAWAAGYYCASYAVARDLGLSPVQARHPRFLFSPAYLDGLARVRLRRGGGKAPLKAIALRQIAEVIGQSGCASLLEAPYKAGQVAGRPEPVALERARHQNLVAHSLYAGLANGDPANPEALKNLLYQEKSPIAISILHPKNFPARGQAVAPGFVYKRSGPNRVGDFLTVPLSLVLVGYDDSKKAFRAVNSWGRGWADGGGLWIDEGFIAQSSLESYLVQTGLKNRNPTFPQGRALVVGIDRYPGLKAPALQAAETDAQVMLATLEEQGFKASAILGAQATRNNILLRLRQLKQVSTARTPLVVYFAGHGSVDAGDKAVLLPVDAREDSDQNDLTAQEIAVEMAGIKAKSRTLIADTCFSGALGSDSLAARGIGDEDDARPRVLGKRYHRRALSARKADNPRANHQENLALIGAAPVCFLSAGRGNQPAYEAEFGGAPQGVFTHYLLRYMTGAKPRYGALLGQVAAEIQTQIPKIRQTPTVSPAFIQTELFAPPSPPRQSTDFFQSQPDPGVLSVELGSDQSVFRIGEVLSYRVKTTRPGYLVVYNQGSAGDLRLFFPASGAVKDAFVRSYDQTSEGDVAGPPGTDRLRAILFRDFADAMRWLSAFPEGSSGPRLPFADLMAVLQKPAPDQTPAPPAGMPAAAWSGSQGGEFFTGEIEWATVR